MDTAAWPIYLKYHNRFRKTGNGSGMRKKSMDQGMSSAFATVGSVF
jgi:hypothetical protein